MDRDTNVYIAHIQGLEFSQIIALLWYSSSRTQTYLILKNNGNPACFRITWCEHHVDLCRAKGK